MKILSMVSDPIVILDENANICLANPAMMELLSLEQSPTLSGTLERFLDSSSWNDLLHNGVSSMHSENVWRGRLRLVTALNKTTDADAQLFVVEDHHKFSGNLCLMISSRIEPMISPSAKVKKNPKLLVRSKRVQMPLIFVLDIEGRLIDVNQVTLKATRIEKEKLIGENFWDLSIWSSNQNFENECSTAIQASRNGSTERKLAALTDVRGTHAWIELTYTPVPNHPNKIDTVLIEGRDVTARIEAEIKQRLHTEKLEQLSKELIRAQENERRRIAQELHDEIGQSLTALRLSLHNVRGSVGDEVSSKRIGVCMRVVDQVLTQIRSLSLNLWPTMLDDLGLVAALGWFITRQQELTGLTIELNTQLGGSRWAMPIEISCFRIAQEAISNAMRYSGANKINVSLVVEESELVLTVVDAGLGFQPGNEDDFATGGSSLGLVGMQQRAELANGTINIESVLNKGTKVCVRFPIDTERAAVKGEVMVEGAKNGD